MATPRSLTASQSGLTDIQKCLTALKWSYEDLAAKADLSRTTAINFCTGKKVDRKNFVTCCEKLDLDWEAVVGQKVADVSAVQVATDLDHIIQQLRSASEESLRQRCGTMRILDMTQPVDTGAIYTDVNILEKVAGKTRREIQELIAECGVEQFDRFFLGGVRQKRVPGFEAVLQKKLLMILGRPGAGKTTFLKRLAIECLNGTFLGDRFPVFVTLKEFAESEGQPGILEFVGGDEALVKQVLVAGKALVLFDGLDEVLERDHDRVIREIREFAQTYSQNHMVITCRIAAREYIFQQFTEVEMADFDDEQIQSFANKWFKTKEENPDSKTGEMFWQELKSREPVMELATNPLLLTLLCLEFDNSAAFPQSRSELYDRALNLLLSKWDGQRRIQRGEEVYKGLSLKRKETLLGQLAMATFERGDYFFKERSAIQQIEQYIRNLPGAKDDPAALEVDSRAVLKSIEARHGLLTERARGVYSFSHLTFQEYFTAKNILELSNRSAREAAFEMLMEHLGEKRWKEVILLVVEGLDSADDFLELMQSRMNAIMGDDFEFQRLLEWVQAKSESVEITDKLNLVRAFYFAIALTLDLNFALTMDLDSTLYDELSPPVEPDDDDLHLASILSYGRSDGDLALALARNRVLHSDPEGLAYARELVRELARARARALSLAGDQDLALARVRARAIDLDLTLAVETGLRYKLQELRSRLFECNNEDQFEWWQQHGQKWNEDFRQILIDYRETGYDWQFTDDQKQKLQQYYDANLLLAECLNSECYLSREVREEIESRMIRNN